MAVSNSVIIYQLHWESKQLRLNKEQEDKMKLQIRFQLLKDRIFKEIDKNEDRTKLMKLLANCKNDYNEKIQVLLKEIKTNKIDSRRYS